MKIQGQRLALTFEASTADYLRQFLRLNISLDLFKLPPQTSWEPYKTKD